MSDAAANIETIRGFHAGMEAGDREALGRPARGARAPRVRVVSARDRGRGPRLPRQKRARAFFDDFLSAFTVSYDESVIQALGEAGVLVLCRMKLRGRESGIEMEQEMGVVYELEEWPLSPRPGVRHAP